MLYISMPPTGYVTWATELSRTVVGRLRASWPSVTTPSRRILLLFFLLLRFVLLLRSVMWELLLPWSREEMWEGFEVPQEACVSPIL